MADYVDSLLSSFRRVPPTAVAPMLDCILLSTNAPPSSLFSSLLDAFPKLTEDILQHEGSESDHHNFIASFVGALCHLSKKSGSDVNALRHFATRVLIPLTKLIHYPNRDVVSQAITSFLEIVVEANCWVVVEETMIPYFLRKVGLSMGMLQSGDRSVYRWGHIDKLSNIGVDEDSFTTEFGPFQLLMSCHVLTLILDASLQSEFVLGPTSVEFAADQYFVRTIAGTLLWDVCELSIQMLLQSSEHRSCAMKVLLPRTLKAFISGNAFEIFVCGQKFVLSRKQFFFKIWRCCKTLFALGPSERRDAYAILSLYLSFFDQTDGCEDGEETSDLRAEKEFWNEIKRGLVDKEGIVRKQSLHILKMTMQRSKENQQSPGVSETMSNDKGSVSNGMTKREKWADKEAKSLGVGKIYDSDDFGLHNQQKWGAFFLLYEMLEEYGTHLVEAAWSSQINLLLNISLPCDNPLKLTNGGLHHEQLDTSEEIFDWLVVLWQRGFCHDNPLVRCLIMESFLGIDWKKYGQCTKLVPEDFVLGPFIEGLNDPVHHKEFGLRGIYSSRTIEGANKFLKQYTICLDARKQIEFLCNLASLAKKYSFCRAGLMSLAECISSAACVNQANSNLEIDHIYETSYEPLSYCKKAELLDIFRFVIESSKQHFNPHYRVKVCGRVLDAAVSAVSVLDVPLEILLLFISTIPQEFTDYGGQLRVKVQEWLVGPDHKYSPYGVLLKRMIEFPRSFIRHTYSVDGVVTYDDEDLELWEFESKRWARVLFLLVKEEDHVDPLLLFIREHCVYLCKSNSFLEWIPVKFLVLIMSLFLEVQNTKDKKGSSESGLLEIADCPYSLDSSQIAGKFAKLSASLLEELVSFAYFSCSIFWSDTPVGDNSLPSSLRGKLGGPSQRRLSSLATTMVLRAISSVKILASIALCCALHKNEVPDSALHSLVEISWKIIQCSTFNSETEAEILLGAYEALSHLLKGLSCIFSPLVLDLLVKKSEAEATALLDSVFHTFLQNINKLITNGNLTRSRRAVLMDWKWICLESLLSISKYALQTDLHMKCCNFFSETMLRWIFSDIIDSLENAGEGSVLPILRSVRLVLELFALGRMGSVVSSCAGVDVQMMWQLVRSAWILHSSCNKRRVAPIAALLSSILHCSVFGDERMHFNDNAPGPLKWLVQKILEEGTRSPRTIRLAALHLTGLWLSYPSIIKYYLKELKLLTLYGSVAFDEDFEAEVAENHDARSEISVLARIPDSELTQVFINTELYARVSVAVMFYKLADLADSVGSRDENDKCRASFLSGKLFLLELLDAAVNDKDLAKELYKKYSATHRRKVRVWQMICILSRFVDQEIVEEVSSSLHMSLYRNNLPAVRQYLETFAIYLYMRFPSLVREQLVPLIRDYNMRTQALSSYVFIAASVILHATQDAQSRHFNELLPPIIPLLTSHHHSLRGFAQLLVYQVLSKLLPALDSGASETLPLEKRCFAELKFYLDNNSDCTRLRSSMEGHLDAFDPKKNNTPAGIFSNRVEDLEFECAPASLLERVIDFLNDVRNDLRSSMAKDASVLKNEQILSQTDQNCVNLLDNRGEGAKYELSKDLSLDFQKKVTFSKYEIGDGDSDLMGNKEVYEPLIDVEKEGDLIDFSLQSRSIAKKKLKEGRQSLILVASLLDRIPNLAGLARTCEVFKVSSLAIADRNIILDKQFQLISVTADRWMPIIELPVSNVKVFLEKKQQEGFSILGLEQTANSIPLDKYPFPKKTVLVLGREKEGIPVDLIHILDACIEIPQLGVIRSLNVHVSGAIALWEYTRQQRGK